ncbi:Glutamyl-tRNA reductase [Rubripirellula lacrimiformis]|uniref:Glutamyl-tRNA reductase n=1 Tax=Rubripirellula lacrimiformis TaxID=1930273 RepID=A0A517NLQ9_9BACT|nr:glutamyl-tRNA reductase [Rubripirellula lacrimiformis]QDT08068.1 Glutamyl-tRNA reductase [Rubripirellula lacrimiformis]
MIGCSHHDAAVEFREKIAFTSSQVSEALKAFRSQFPGGELVLVSTCNRIELYTTTGDDQQLDRDAVAKFLADQHSLGVDEVIDQMIYRAGIEAVEHLFTVAASLDSMVVGEAQILAQVKQAYDLACVNDSAGAVTHSVFQAANRAAKRVQQETSIHRRRVSVPSVAVGEVIPEVFDSLRKKRVVICGAGEMGEETLRYLQQAGASDVHILNRSHDRAVALAKSFDAVAVPWSELNDEVVAADVLIGATSATEPIITHDAFVPLHTRRRNRVLLILDLAVPRDFDPSIGEMTSVYLYGIDDLKAACERNRRERQKEWPKAKQIIAEETERFVQAIHHRATGPVIQRLRSQANELKKDELDRLKNKLALDPADTATAKEIEKSFDRLINKLLHPPLASIRDDAAEGHRQGLLEAVRQLFNLGDD